MSRKAKLSERRIDGMLREEWWRGWRAAQNARITEGQPLIDLADMPRTARQAVKPEEWQCGNGKQHSR